MLRKLKIGTRVNVLIAVPLIALIALAAVSFVSLQRASVRGDEYRQLKTAESLRNDLVPPRANLISAWSSVSKIGVLVASPVTSRTNAEIETELTKLAEARAEFIDAITYWRAQPLEADQQAAFESGAKSGEVFFDKVDSLLLSAMVERDPSIVLSAVRAIEYDYNIQQIYIGQSLSMVDGEVASREASTDDFVTTVQWVMIGAVALLLAALLLIAIFVRRSIVRPILALSSQARRSATTDLPEAVRQIQNLPADAPMPTIEEFHTETRDELADLSASFNSVQNAALDLAAEQAMARRVVQENLTNIARRTQSLLGRTLGSLTDMEQTERDPETLDKLFRLDHLTTRLRRNAQSLLVLADAEQNRMWSPPVPLGDVVRAALSEIEHYSRIELGDLGDHGSVAVTGALAPDVAHLLAELLENATSFSSPSTKVMIVGRSIGAGHQLAIVDYGIGMSQDELDAANAGLRRHAQFDAVSSKVLGFQVVARIGARLGIQVVLANTAGATGITAIIKLPPDLFDSRTAPPVTADNGARIVGQPDVGQRDLHLANPATLSAATALAATTLVDRDTPVADEPWDAGADMTSPAPSLTSNGLPKRVRGAQLPDLGGVRDDGAGWDRPADEVRSSLSSLQRGTDLARQRTNDTNERTDPS